jgi:hypothetical protein
MTSERRVTMRLLSPESRSTARALLLALGLAITVTACASVDPAPFTQFASSLQPLRAGSDAQAGAAVDASRQDLIREVAEAEVNPADLQLELTDPFKPTYGFFECEPGEPGESSEPCEPNFVKFNRFRQGLAALNDAMVAYAQSLVVLAGAGEGGDILPTTAQFDELARDLNANAGTAASALGVSLDPGRQALLSAAAVELFKAYIENQRREALARAIAEVQPRVAEFSSSAQQAVRILASLVVTDYSKKVLPLATASPPNAEPILVLNDATQANLATLESLSKSYGALPAAHRDLSAAASMEKTGLAGLVALGDEAIRLQGLVTQLKAANAAAAPGPKTE